MSLNNTPTPTNPSLPAASTTALSFLRPDGDESLGTRVHMYPKDSIMVQKTSFGSVISLVNNTPYFEGQHDIDTQALLDRAWMTSGIRDEDKHDFHVAGGMKYSIVTQDQIIPLDNPLFLPFVVITDKNGTVTSQVEGNEPITYDGSHVSKSRRKKDELTKGDVETVDGQE